MAIEAGGTNGDASLKFGNGGSANHHRIDVELFGKLVLPLFAQVRRTQHTQPLSITPVQEFTDNHARFDCLADPDIVGYEQPHRVQAESHDQRDKLIWPRSDREPT